MQGSLCHKLLLILCFESHNVTNDKLSKLNVLNIDYVCTVYPQMDRQHAREAVSRLRKGIPKGLGKLNCSNPEAVRIATDLALGLEKGEP